MRRVLTLFAASIVAAGVVVGAAPVAWASTITDNIVPTGQTGSSCHEGSLGNARPCQTDNAQVTYYAAEYGSRALESADMAVVNYVIAEYGYNTDLTTSEEYPPVFFGPNETDIFYEEGPVPSPFDGYTWCDDDSPGGWKCDQQYIRIEDNGAYSHGLTCHETGHAVGLTHGSDANPTVPNGDNGLDCMQTPVSVSQALGANSIGNINHVY